MSLFLMYDSEDVVIKSNLEVTYNFSWNGPMYSLKRYIIHCMWCVRTLACHLPKLAKKRKEGKDSSLSAMFTVQ